MDKEIIERLNAVWFEVSTYGPPKITPVRVLHETAHQVVLADCHPSKARRAKAGRYFPTWGEAHQYLMDKAAGKIAAARGELERWKAWEGNAKDLKPPNVGAKREATDGWLPGDGDD